MSWITDFFWNKQTTGTLVADATALATIVVASPLGPVIVPAVENVVAEHSWIGLAASSLLYFVGVYSGKNTPTDPVEPPKS